MKTPQNFHDEVLRAVVSTYIHNDNALGHGIAMAKSGLTIRFTQKTCREVFRDIHGPNFLTQEYIRSVPAVGSEIVLITRSVNGSCLVADHWAHACHWDSEQRAFNKIRANWRAQSDMVENATPLPDFSKMIVVGK